MQIILKAMQAKRITNRDSVQCTAKLPQHGKPGHLMRSSVKLKLYTTGSDNEAGASAIGTYDMKNTAQQVFGHLI